MTKLIIVEIRNDNYYKVLQHLISLVFSSSCHSQNKLGFQSRNDSYGMHATVFLWFPKRTIRINP